MPTLIIAYGESEVGIAFNHELLATLQRSEIDAALIEKQDLFESNLANLGLFLLACRTVDFHTKSSMRDCHEVFGQKQKFDYTCEAVEVRWSSDKKTYDQTWKLRSLHFIDAVVSSHIKQIYTCMDLSTGEELIQKLTKFRQRHLEIVSVLFR